MSVAYYARRRLERRRDEALDELEQARFRYGRAERAFSVAREIARVSPSRRNRVLARAGAELFDARSALWLAETRFIEARTPFDAAAGGAA